MLYNSKPQTNWFLRQKSAATQLPISIKRIVVCVVFSSLLSKSQNTQKKLAYALKIYQSYDHWSIVVQSPEQKTFENVSSWMWDHMLGRWVARHRTSIVSWYFFFVGNFKFQTNNRNSTHTKKENFKPNKLIH